MDNKEKSFKGAIINIYQIPPFNVDENVINSGVNLESEPSKRISPETSFRAKNSQSILVLTEPNFRTSLDKKLKKKSVAFFENQEKKNNVIEKKNSNGDILNERKLSSIVQMLFSTRIPKSEKFVSCLNNFITVHIIAILMTVIKIIFVSDYHVQCWMKKICECADFQTRLISSFFYIFTFLNIIIVTISNSLVQVIFKTSLQKFVSSIIFYAICFLFSFIYLLSIDYMNALPLYFFISVVPFIFHIKVFFEYDKNCMRWAKNTLTINCFSFLLFAHYFCCTRLFPEINYYIRGAFGNLDNNMIKFYQFVYFQIFYSSFVKLFKRYNRFILSFPYNEFSSTIILIRFSSTFFVAVPIAGILGMENFGDWGGYILILSYSVFVFSFYTRVDVLFILKYLYSKFIAKRKIEQKPEEEEQNQNDILCAQIISGSLIDLALIMNSRLLILMITKRWFTYPVIDKFYRGCSFEFSSEWDMNYYGAFAVIIINSCISLILVIYMVCKKKVILEYKKPKNFLLNLYFLFMMHGLLEGLVQMIYYVNK